MITFSFSKKVILSFLCTGFILLHNAFAQVPTITGFTPSNGNVKISEILTINGNNFGTNPADLEVRFGEVKAEVITAIATQITVRVPYGAQSVSMISIRNKITGLTGYSTTVAGGTNSITIVRDVTGISGSTYSGTVYSTGQPNVVSTAPGDFNNDGRMDFINITQTGQLRLSLRSANNTTFTTSSIGTVSGTIYRDMTVADFNGDGNLDFTTTSISGTTVTTPYIGDGTGNFTPETALAMGSLQMTFTAAGDWNKDGKTDIAIAQATEVRIFLRNGTNDGFTVENTIAVFSTAFCWGLATADFNNDGRTDLLVSSYNDTQTDIAVLLRNGTGTDFQAPSLLPAGMQYSAFISVGDFNKDGNDDIICASNSEMKARWALGTGTGTFGGFNDINTADVPQDLCVGDFDGDGYHDVAIIHADKTVRVYVNNTAGFNPDISYAFDNGSFPSTCDLDVADFNIDGLPDFLASYPASGVQNVSLLYFSPSALITSDLSGSYCGGATINVFIQANSILGSVNMELSDENGDFSSPTPTLIGTTLLPVPAMDVTFPTNVPSGTKYRMRLVGPGGEIGADSHVDFEIEEPPTTATAGPPQDICPVGPGMVMMSANPPTVGTGTWSGGPGIDSPASPVTSISGLSPGSYIYTWTISTAGGICSASADNVSINVTAAPTVDPGGPLTGCGTSNIVITGANASNYSTVGWMTSGDGSFSPDAATLNAEYIPTVNDVSAGNITLTLNASSANIACMTASTNFSLTLSPGGDVYAGADQTLCSTLPLSDLADATSTDPTSISWTSSGTGSFTPDNLTLNAIYTPTAADIAGGSVTLTLDLPPNAPCSDDTDDMVVIYVAGPIVDPGIALNGCGTGAVPLTAANASDYELINWTTTGTGTFNPNENTLNPDYTPSGADVTAGNIILGLNASISNPVCPTATTNFTLTLSSSPDVFAGTDKSVCRNNPAAALSDATSTNPLATSWSTTGTGSFNPDNTTLNATYIPSATDLLGSSVSIMLNLPPIASCPGDNDEVIVTFTAAPTADAGPPVTTMCNTSSNAALSGSVTIASGGTWSTSGTGNFSNATSLTPTYTPSAADRSAGTVNLTFTTTGNGNCVAVNDVITLSITSNPTAFAGNNQNVCKNNPTVSLNGSFTHASNITWSGGIGSFNPGNTTAVATYIPAVSEITAGQLTLLLTTNDPDGIGPCTTATDDILIRFTNAPTAEAGDNGSSCTNDPDIENHGTVTVASGGTWTTTGTGTFTPSANSLNAVYHPTPADTVSGSVTLTLTTTGNGNCLSVNDFRVVVFTPKPIVEAGSYPDICGNSSASLSGTVVGASGGKWSTDGAGSFSPENNVNSKYNASESDGGKTILLILTSTGNAGCTPVRDTAVLNVLRVPNAYAGENFKFCDFSVPASLSGSEPGTNQVGTWSQASGASTVVFADPHNHVTEASNLVAEGEFIFQWKLENTLTGCKDSSVVHIFQCELPEVNVFNVLSPNADGKHDFLELEYAEVYPKNRVLIYNRWGEVVFETTGYDNKDITFTGKSNIGNGDDLPDGTYYYVIIPKEGGENEKGFFVIRH